MEQFTAEQNSLNHTGTWPRPDLSRVCFGLGDGLLRLRFPLDRCLSAWNL